MGLADIAHRDSVLKAIAECDSMGELRFLSHYGFGPSRKYHLVHEGRHYPSKAIVGVAHRFEFPQRGQLRAADFSGGENTVRRKLEDLGFQVAVSGRSPDAEDSQSPVPRCQPTVPMPDQRPHLAVRHWDGPHVATVIVESDGRREIDERMVETERVLAAVAAHNVGPCVVLFPGGWFRAGSRPATPLIEPLGRRVSSLVRRVAGKTIAVCFGLDGRRKEGVGTRDQLSLFVTESGITAVGRKNHPAPGEEIVAYDSWQDGEEGYERIASFGGKKFFLAVCYDVFGIKHERWKRPAADAVLDNVHGFWPRGEGDSGDVLFARHGLAGAAGQWTCPVFAAAVFFNRPVPGAWPSGVAWNRTPGSTTGWTYDDNALSPSQVFNVALSEGRAEVRVFS